MRITTLAASLRFVVHNEVDILGAAIAGGTVGSKGVTWVAPGDTTIQHPMRHYHEHLTFFYKVSAERITVTRGNVVTQRLSEKV